MTVPIRNSQYKIMEIYGLASTAEHHGHEQMERDRDNVYPF